MHVPVLKAADLIDPDVQSACHVEYSIKNTTPLHRHDYYEFFIITSGRCIHHINGETQELEKDMIVFIRPDDTHGYDELGDAGCQFINVNFYKEAVKDAFTYLDSPPIAHKLENRKIPPCIALPHLEAEMLVRKSMLIPVYTTIDKKKAKIQARSVLTDALTYFLADDHDDTVKKMPAWLDSLLLELQKKENFTSILNPLQALSNKSSGHLNRIFKQYLHMTPTAYLNHLRLSYARNLILTTNMSIFEISYESGFDNLSHFYHLFKKSFGTSPGKMRYLSPKFKN
jgi:AraC family cel operon transcriptional repressor